MNIFLWNCWSFGGFCFAFLNWMNMLRWDHCRLPNGSFWVQDEDTSNKGYSYSQIYSRSRRVGNLTWMTKTTHMSSNWLFSMFVIRGVTVAPCKSVTSLVGHIRPCLGYSCATMSANKDQGFRWFPVFKPPSEMSPAFSLYVSNTSRTRVRWVLLESCDVKGIMKESAKVRALKTSHSLSEYI